MDTHEVAAAQVRAAGQRYTVGRRQVVNALMGAGRPSTIPELLDLDNSMPQSSLYRNLSVLEDADVVRRVVTADEFARYELAEELTEHHHHLICSSCGTVTDFTATSTLEATLDRTIDEVADSTGFVAEHHQLDLVGTCADCH